MAVQPQFATVPTDAPIDRWLTPAETPPINTGNLNASFGGAAGAPVTNEAQSVLTGVGVPVTNGG